MPDRSPRELGGSLQGVVRNAFITGVAVVVPLLITLIVLAVAGRYVYSYLDRFSNYVLGLGPEATLRFTTPLGPVAVGKESLIELATPVVLASLVLAVGLFIDTTRYGGVAVDYFDAGIARIPGVGSVYESFRQMSDVMLEEDTQNFREVKLVEFPHEGAYTLGFVTTETPAALAAPTGHDRMLTLFLPLAPNPVMGGHLVHMPASRVMDVDMTVEEGVRAVVTSGVAVAGGSAPGAGGLSEDELRELASVEHADQQLDPEADSPDLRREDDVEPDRDERYDRQVAAPRAGTPSDIARRTRARRDSGSTEESEPREPTAEDEQPYSLYGAREHTTTPAREAGRYEPEAEDTETRPAAAGDRPREQRESEDLRPEEAGDRPEEARAETDGRPAEVREERELDGRGED